MGARELDHSCRPLERIDRRHSSSLNAGEVAGAVVAVAAGAVAAAGAAGPPGAAARGGSM